jgi:hypothetical protein
MPLYDYACGCGHKTEELFRVSHEIPTSIFCEVCGDIATKEFPLVSRTASAWAEQTSETGGYYSIALGQQVAGEHEANAIAESKGFVRADSYGKHFYDDFTEKKKATIAKQDKINDTFQENVKKFDGNKEMAMSETFTAADCLSGANETDY